MKADEHIILRLAMANNEYVGVCCDDDVPLQDLRTYRVYLHGEFIGVVWLDDVGIWRRSGASMSEPCSSLINAVDQLYLSATKGRT